MSTSKQTRVLSQDDEDDEAAFLSADEGEDDDQLINDPMDSIDMVEKSISTAQHSAPPMETPKPIQSQEEARAVKIEKLELDEPARSENAQKKTTTTGGDGWDLDDWDAEADEDVERNEDSDVDEIMTTPASERPPLESMLQMNMPNQSFRRDVQIEQPRESTTQKPNSLWGGWGQQLLSLASDSISTLTNTVGEGFTSVLESVETTLGAPTPEELAVLSMQERAALKKKADEVKEPAPVGERDDCDSVSEEASSEGGSDAGTARSDKEDILSSGYQSDGPGFQRTPDMDTQQKRDHGFTSLISGVSNLFENTGKSLVTSSLDVLETLGRKTFETVTVAESSGSQQRRRLKIPIPSSVDRSEKPNLSQVLRELKEKAEIEAKQRQQEKEARRYNYASLFEDAQGLVHLEALELLSTTCCQQTRSLMELLTPDQMEDVAMSMENLKLLFDTADKKPAVDEDPPEQNLAISLKQNLKFTSFSPNRLLTLDEETRNWINRTIVDQEKGSRIDAKEIYEKCLQTLATFTGAGVEMYHKLGQLMLIPSANMYAVRSMAGGDNLAVRSLISITQILADELSFLSARYTTALNTASDDSEDPDSVNRMLTSVFFEASNSVGYVQEAFKLMLPVVQLANVRELLR